MFLNSSCLYSSKWHLVTCGRRAWRSWVEGRGRWWPCPSFWPCCCSSRHRFTSWMRWTQRWISRTHRILATCWGCTSSSHRSVVAALGLCALSLVGSETLAKVSCLAPKSIWSFSSCYHINNYFALPCSLSLMFTWCHPTILPFYFYNFLYSFLVCNDGALLIGFTSRIYLFIVYFKVLLYHSLSMSVIFCILSCSWTGLPLSNT